jgi:predicted phage-related endonuclease
MKTHVLIQGNPDWDAHRAGSWNASDAPAMMGCSPYKTRGQLLQELATGITEEITPEQQAIFDDGHRFEALYRPMAEKITGEELAPVTGTGDVVIGGRHLSASFDGIDFMETLALEHKSLNKGLREAFDRMADFDSEFDKCDCLPLLYRIQMEQQIIVSKVERVLFGASKWELKDGEWSLVEERHCWYYPDEELAAQIRLGWTQFAEDLAKWKPAPAEPDKPVGKAPASLPALRIEVTGAVTASNIEEFKAVALGRIHEVNTTLETDQDFADADMSVKWCEDVESRVAAAKDHALSQSADVYAVLKALDDIKAEAARVRINLEKKVTARKTSLKTDIVVAGRTALVDHIAALNTGLGAAWVVMTATTAAEFTEAIKNKRSFDSMRTAVDAVLTRHKIAATQDAERFKVNRARLNVDGRDWFSLFPDFTSVGAKAAEDFEALAQLRINKQLEEERKAKEAKEAREAAEAAAAAAAATPAPAPAPAVEAPAPAPAPMFASVASVSRPVSRPVAAPAANEPATLKLGSICERLGFTMTAAFVSEHLGIEPAATDKSAKLYRESDYSRICVALVEHINKAQQVLRQAA